MTAELSDAFENRERGVLSIAAICAREIGAETVFYAGEKGFLPKAGVEAAASEIASANWRASAELVARARPLALFVDMGSTTTDIIPIRGGAVAARGTDDAGRLVNGELVYAGLLRGSPATGLPLAPVAVAGVLWSTSNSRHGPTCIAFSAKSRRTRIRRPRWTGVRRRRRPAGFGSRASLERTQAPARPRPGTRWLGSSRAPKFAGSRTP